jgi:hypothetical protein
MQRPLDLGFQWTDIESEEEEESGTCLGKDLEHKLTTHFQDDVKLFRHVDGCRQTVDRERKIYGGQIFVHRRESLYQTDQDRDVTVIKAKVTGIDGQLVEMEVLLDPGSAHSICQELEKLGPLKVKRLNFSWSQQPLELKSRNLSMIKWE